MFCKFRRAMGGVQLAEFGRVMATFLQIAVAVVEFTGVVSRSIEIALKIRRTRMFGIPAVIVCALLFLGSLPALRIIPTWIGWPAGVIWIALVWFLSWRIGQLRKSF